jgi:hypothetical protein
VYTPVGEQSSWQDILRNAQSQARALIDLIYIGSHAQAQLIVLHDQLNMCVIVYLRPVYITRPDATRPDYQSRRVATN